MSRAALIATVAGLVATVLLVLAGTWFAILSARDAAQTADRRWCATLALLTSVPQQSPADPAANPSRVEGYQLYTDFLKLKNEFGCGS